MGLQPRYLVAAVVLHVLLFGALFASALFTRKIVAPPVIEAVLLEDPRALRDLQAGRERERQVQEQQRREQQQHEEQRRVEQERKRQEQERKVTEEIQLKLEEEKRRKREEFELKAEAERRRIEEERKKAEEEKRRQDELRRKQEEEQKRLLEQERQRQLEEERREIERVKREREAEERRRRDELAADMAAEQDARDKEARRAAQAPWSAAVVEKIRRNWQRPPGSAERFSCRVQIEQIPGGEVVRATVVRSCGSAVLDRSVESAVLKASPLPSPADPSLFDRAILATFCPTPDAC